MEEPVFLLSSERSGSNLVRVVLDSHRIFCGPTTPHLLRIFAPLLPFYGDLRDDANFDRLARDMASAIANHVGDWVAKPTGDDLVGGVGNRSFAALLGAAYDMEAAANGKTRVLIKDNGNIDFMFHLLAQYPAARFVYNVRDARDAVVSGLSTPGRRGGAAAAAREWQENQERVLQGYALLHQTAKIHLIYYEDLITQPEDVCRELCAFLGEEFDPAMLEFYKSKQAEKSAQAAWAWENLSSPFMSQNFGKWRTKLSRRQQRTVESIAGREMLALGYPLEFPWTGAAAQRNRLRQLAGGALSALQHFLRGKAGRDEVARRMPRFRNLQRIQKEVGLAPARLSGPKAFATPPDKPE